MTDYEPGDFPVPRGATVRYNSELYEVVDYVPPETHPTLGFLETLGQHYPDGVAYYLWPVGVAKKFGNRHLSYNFVRRTSFMVVPDDGED